MPKGIPKSGENKGWFESKEKIIKECDWCGKEFKVNPSRKDSASYCSRDCYNTAKMNGEFEGEKIEMTCQNCGKKYKVFPSRSERTKYCSRECQVKAISPDKLSKEHKQKISESNKGNKRPDLAEWNRKNPKRGKNNPAWKGGKTPITKRVRHSSKYEEWQNKILERDDYTCQDCGKRQGDKHVHHIKSFSKIWDENDIKTFCEALDCKELWDIDNGITLCPNCHYKKH